MNNRFKKALALAGMGGLAFQFGLSNATCVSNTGLTNFYSQSGDAAINAFTDPARALGSDFEAVVVDPATNFFQNMWNNWVFGTIPQDDPAQATLLVN